MDATTHKQTHLTPKENEKATTERKCCLWQEDIKNQRGSRSFGGHGDFRAAPHRTWPVEALSGFSARFDSGRAGGQPDQELTLNKLFELTSEESKHLESSNKSEAAGIRAPTASKTDTHRFR